jgi:hypothetical protein
MKKKKNTGKGVGIAVAAAVVGALTAGVVVALNTEKGKEVAGKAKAKATETAGKVKNTAVKTAGKVKDTAKAGAAKAKAGVLTVKDKLTGKKADDAVVVEVSADEIEALMDDEMPEIEDVPAVEVEVSDEQA